MTLRRSEPLDPHSYREQPGAVRFGADRDLCAFDAAGLRARIVGADPEILSVLEPRRAARRRTRHVANFVATFLAAELHGLPTLASVARALAVSLGSLQLRLADEGTTFSSIVDRVQRERALALLSSSDLSITTIATAGFSTSRGSPVPSNNGRDAAPPNTTRPDCVGDQ